MVNCPKCKKTATDKDGCLCTACNQYLHYTDCAGVSKDSWKSMGTTRRSEWICPFCRDPASTTKIRAPLLNVDVTDKHDKELEIEKSTMDALKKYLHGMEDRMMKQMNSKFAEFQASLEFTSGKMEDLEKTMKSVDQKIILMDKRQTKLENENIELKTRLRKLETELQTKSQESNNHKLELSGLPPIDDNNIKQVAYQFIEKVGINQAEVGTFQVNKLYKPEATRSKTTVVISFQTQNIRDNIMKKMKQGKIYLKVKDVVPNSNEETNVYANEYLTGYYRKLFYEANMLKKQKNFSYLWVKEGKILLKKKEGDSVVRLTNMDDLGKL